jgi:5-methylcytosine-specific restriction protein A
MPTAAPMHRPPGQGPRRDYRQERAQRLSDPAQRLATRLRSSARWQKARAWILAQEPLCRDPYGVHVGRVVLAEEVDHVVPLAQRPDLLTEVRNLQPLCRSCHRTKSGLERAGK